MNPGAAEPILRLHRIRKEFVPSGGSAFLFPSRRRRSVLAVDDLSLHIAGRETYGLVGESGSGKSTTGRIAVGLLSPDSGEVLFRASSPPRATPASRRPPRRGRSAPPGRPP